MILEAVFGSFRAMKNRSFVFMQQPSLPLFCLFVNIFSVLCSYFVSLLSKFNIVSIQLFVSGYN